MRTWVIELDLASLEQTRNAAEKINSLDQHIDVVVNNAGIMAHPYSTTVGGIESQFGTNHVGHFLLTNLLLPNILASRLPIRVINVASNGFRFGPPRYEDWNFNVRSSKASSAQEDKLANNVLCDKQDGKTYNRWIAYAQSKSANMLFSISLARKLGKQGLVSVSLHPGIIFTGLGKHLQMEDFGEFGMYIHLSFWIKC